MKARLLIAIACMLSLAINAQPLLQATGSYWHMPVLDELIQTYNIAHPWQETQIRPIAQAYSLAAGWNQSIYAPRAIQGIATLEYSFQNTLIESPSQTFRAGFHAASAMAYVRSHPKCLTTKIQSSGPLGTRWYLELGGGWQWNMPYVRKFGTAVTIHDGKPYRSFSSNVVAYTGTGWHALTIGSLVLTLHGGVRWNPSLHLTEFATAIQGHNETGLKNSQSNVWQFQGGIRLTWSSLRKNWWDEPRKGDKS
ncbi:MAG: hypothetical protein ACK478_02820 [Flavobacteriales bacterium]|jgi:hypothetical protein